MLPTWLFVGSGHLAWHLLTLISPHKYLECYLSARNETSKKDFLQRFAIKEASQLNTPPECIWLCVKDSEIKHVSEYWRSQYPDAVQIHCSGATSIEELQSACKMVWYPLQSFTKGQIIDWTQVPVFIESKGMIPSGLAQLHQKVKINTSSVTSSQRLSIHLAAVMSANFSTHLLRLAEILLQEHHLSLDILQPLVMSSIQKSFLIGPSSAQTGPAIRRDEQTIQKHKELLTNHPDIEKLYTLLTESIQKNN